MGKTRITRRDAVALGFAATLSSLSACAQTRVDERAGALPRKIPVFKNEAAKARYMEKYDAVLRDWAVPYESLFLPTRFGTTHVVAAGPATAPPVFLMPALLTTATSWRPNVATLSQHFRCYAVDVVGEINKSEPTRPLQNRKDCGEWLTDLMDALKLDKASFVGASLGGFFSLNQALHAPSRVERIVLIGPAVVLSMTWKIFWYSSLAMLGIEGPMDRWFSQGLPANPADESSAQLWVANAEGKTQVNDINLGNISFEEWRTVRAPSLLLIGDREVIYTDPPQEVLQRALKEVPGLQGEIVPNANHLAARTNPEFVNERVVKFLSSE